MDTIQSQIEQLIIILIGRFVNKRLAFININDDIRNDLALDSIDFKILIVKIENEFHIFIYDEELTKIRTISDVVNIVIEKKHPELLVKG